MRLLSFSVELGSARHRITVAKVLITTAAAKNGTDYCSRGRSLQTFSQRIEIATISMPAATAVNAVVRLVD